VAIEAISAGVVSQPHHLDEERRALSDAFLVAFDGGAQRLACVIWQLVRTKP
jgi:hypothetical protein